MFKIISEQGVGSGVRRIEAVTASDAYDYIQGQLDILNQASGLLKANQTKQVPKRIEDLQEDLKAANKQNEALESKLAAQAAGNVFNDVKQTAKGTLIAAEIKASGMGQLRQMADTWRSQKKSDFLVLGAPVKGKANMLVAVADDKAKDTKAGDIIKACASAIQGGGGGRPTMAQAGGKNSAGIKDALKLAEDYLNK